MSKGKILFQLSGSIACFKATLVISNLVQKGFEVKCVATKGALRFVGAATLEGLTGNPVFSDVYEQGRMMDHINLARWADLFVLCPATANTLNKLAGGIGDDVIGNLFLASGMKKPYLIFPAMNHEMFLHPATQKSIKMLESWGLRVMPTDSGHQACGEVGEGRLLEPNEIVGVIQNVLTEKSEIKPLKILVTGGGTREKIDGVRFIANVSTGRTASELAGHFLKKGHYVTYLGGHGALTQPISDYCKIKYFEDFQSLKNLLKTELQSSKYDLIVHAAAVSDYSVSEIRLDKSSSRPNLKKISSDSKKLTLELKQNGKIINEIKKWSPESYLVAFKLTNEATETEIQRAVEKLVTESHSDLVIHNDLSQLKEKDERLFRLFKSFGIKKNVATVNNIKNLADKILDRSWL